jgi:RWD domain
VLLCSALSPVEATIKFHFTADYPNELPEWEVEAGPGLSAELCVELRELVSGCAAENLGMEMGFTLAMVVQEFLSEHNDDEEKARLSAIQDKKDAERAALEAELAKRAVWFGEWGERA